MEETLKKILNELTELRKGQNGLDNRMGSMENRMGSLENRMCSLEDRLTGFEKRTNERFNQVDAKLDKIEGNVVTLYDKVGEMVEFKLEAEVKLKAIEGGKK